MDGGRANLSGDPDDIVVEMAQFDKEDEESKHDTNKARLRGKINAKPSLSANSTGARFPRAGSGGTAKDDFSSMKHYVIDDDDDDVTDTQQS